MIYNKSGELFVVANRVLRNRCRNGSGGRVCRHAGAAGPGKIHSLFGIAGAAWPSPSGALGQKYPWDCEIERAEIYIVWRIYRVFFFPVSGRKLILLHGFKKKSQETPKRELQTAETRMKDYVHRYGGKI